jgi:hypothetical protein
VLSPSRPLCGLKVYKESQQNTKHKRDLRGGGVLALKSFSDLSFLIPWPLREQGIRKLKSEKDLIITQAVVDS